MKSCQVDEDMTYFTKERLRQGAVELCSENGLCAGMKDLQETGQDERTVVAVIDKDLYKKFEKNKKKKGILTVSFVRRIKRSNA